MYLKIVTIVVLIILGRSGIGVSEELSNLNFNAGRSITPAASSDSLIVNIEGDMLSVKADGIPIKTILEEIVRISGIKGWVFDDIDEEITLDLSNITLQEGLGKILKNKSYGFVCNQEENSVGKLRTIGTKRTSKSRTSSIGNVFNTDNKKKTRKRRSKKKTKGFSSKGKSFEEELSRQGVKGFLDGANASQITDELSNVFKASSPGKTSSKTGKNSGRPTRAKGKAPFPGTTPSRTKKSSDSATDNNTVFETTGGGATFD